MAAAAALLGALLAPSAVASSGDLSVKRITVHGEAELAGLCRVLLFNGAKAGDSASLTITGERLHIELDTTWANTTAVLTESGTSADEFDGGSFQATAFRENHYVFLADVPGRPPPRAQWTGASGHFER